MRMKSLLLSACLSLAFAPAAMAQTIAGSGVAPATAGNSAERAIGFAANAPAGAALVIVMTDATLTNETGDSLTLDGAVIAGGACLRNLTAIGEVRFPGATEVHPKPWRVPYAASRLRAVFS